MVTTDPEIARALRIARAWDALLAARPRGWRFSLYTSFCDQDGETLIVDLYGPERGNKRSVAAGDPEVVMVRAAELVKASIDAPPLVAGGQGRDAADLTAAVHRTRLALLAIVVVVLAAMLLFGVKP